VYTSESLAVFLEHQLEYNIKLSKSSWKQIADLVVELNAAEAKSEKGKI